MKTRNIKELDDVKLITQRFKLITVAKYRDRNKIRKASEKIDKIRSKSRKGGSMTNTIRKWRDSRYAPSS